MLKTIYVGNLPYSTSEDEVRDFFSRQGQVYSVKLIIDRQTGRPRGFGFIRMRSREANIAIQTFNGAKFGGRTLKVNKARQRNYRPGRQYR
jgi:RNA recognition motif-containing protein